MCGLYGYINRGNAKINVRGLVKGLAVSAKTRGAHATGISYNVNNHLCTVKAAVSADQFVFDLPNSVSAVIGHTRHTTQGTQTKNFNNHPFMGVAGQTDFALAHNGVLDNDYELQYSEFLPKTEIETDSYVAVQLIEKYSEGDVTLTLDAIRQMSELVSGMFAFSILDNNNQFWLVRNDSPIHMVYFKRTNLYVYGSTETIVKDGLKKAGLGSNYEVVDVPKGTIVHIDVDGELSFFSFNVNERWYTYDSTKYAMANGGQNLGSCSYATKSTSISTSSFASNAWRDAYNTYDDSDMLYYELLAEGLTEDEIDLVKYSYGISELNQAILDGNVSELLLEALRDEFHESMRGGVGYRGKKQTYVSPIYK
jgi:predicted glutamine amidotransferase